MIDIINAKKVMKDYVQAYNPDDNQIALKIRHIERTAQVAKEIAQGLGLEKEDIDLAELIGLLHDIGRFEQVRLYHTFSDKNSINHGEFGVKILFEDGWIRKFVQDTQYDDIIKKAILNHNRSKIEEGLNEKELLHAKIIRDADKTDILYFLSVEDVEATYETKDMANEKISDEIFEGFVNNHKVLYQNIKTPADLVLAHFAYVFDINFDYTLQNIKDKKYFKTLYESFKFNNEEMNNKYQTMYKIVEQYIEERIK